MRSVSTHWSIAAKPALGDAANGAGVLLVPAKGASSDDDSSAARALAVGSRTPSRQAKIGGAKHAQAGITPCTPDQIARLGLFVFLRTRMFSISTKSENAIAK